MQAERVVRASKVLSSGLKLLWQEIRTLHRGPEGCYASAATLGARLGMEAETVEKGRRELLRFGLLGTLKAERRGRGGASWFPLVPTGWPPSMKPTDPEVLASSATLDAHLRSIGKGGSGSGFPEAGKTAAGSGIPPGQKAGQEGGFVSDKPGSSDGLTSQESRSQMRVSSTDKPVAAGAFSPVRGVGGSLPSSSGVKHQSSLTPPLEGGSAHALEPEGGHRPAPAYDWRKAFHEAASAPRGRRRPESVGDLLGGKDPA